MKNPRDPAAQIRVGMPAYHEEGFNRQAGEGVRRVPGGGEGANMGWPLRLGNVAVAKLLEYVHNGPCLTDVGCTFKMIRRFALQQLAPYMTVGASHFSPELMIALVRTSMRVIEVPVHYRRRLGESKITGNLGRAIRLGLRMIAMILLYRF